MFETISIKVYALHLVAQNIGEYFQKFKERAFFH